MEPLEPEPVAGVDRRELLHLRVEVARRVPAPLQELVQGNPGLHEQRAGRVHVPGAGDLGQVVHADEHLGP